MTEKNKKIFEIVFISIVYTWLVAIFSHFGLRIPSRNRHEEFYGLLFPILSFIIPLIDKKDTSKLIYWSKENIIAQLITIIINIPVIVIININYSNYYFR